MVDVFKSHVQDAFGFIRHPVANLENNTSDERFTVTASNRVAIEKQRKRLANKETEKQVRDCKTHANRCVDDWMGTNSLCVPQLLDQNLYHIKSAPPKLQSKQLQTNTLTALSCRYCSPSLSVSIIVKLVPNEFDSSYG